LGGGLMGGELADPAMPWLLTMQCRIAALIHVAAAAGWWWPKGWSDG
jgi:hypothetical protein